MKQKSKTRTHIGDYVFYAMVLVAVIFVIKNSIRNYLLTSQYRITKAVIIGHKNGMGNNNVARKSTYSYRFCVNDDCYTNNSLNTEYRIGDTISVKYYAPFPDFNEPMSPASPRL